MASIAMRNIKARIKFLKKELKAKEKELDKAEDKVAIAENVQSGCDYEKAPELDNAVEAVAMDYQAKVDTLEEEIKAIEKQIEEAEDQLAECPRRGEIL